jgi:hypothetical protein
MSIIADHLYSSHTPHSQLHAAAPTSSTTYPQPTYRSTPAIGPYITIPISFHDDRHSRNPDYLSPDKPSPSTSIFMTRLEPNHPSAQLSSPRTRCNGIDRSSPALCIYRHSSRLLPAAASIHIHIRYPPRTPPPPSPQPSTQFSHHFPQQRWPME